MDRPEDSGAEHGVYVFGRDDVRQVDRRAVEEFGVPSIVLMENAAIHLAEAAASVLEDAENPSVLICCGPGNNGGDGLAMARHLDNDGYEVAVLLATPGDSAKGDAATNLTIVRRMGLRIEEADESDPQAAFRTLAGVLGGPALVVDALFGTGLDKPVRGAAGAIIGAINGAAERGATVLAVDVPSGLDCDTGRPLGEGANAAVCADVTVTFVGPKRGFLALGAQDYVGEIMVADIGAPMELVRRLGQPLASAERPGEKHAGGARVRPARGHGSSGGRSAR